jgi:OmpA-OmpF porin, OOP family
MKFTFLFILISFHFFSQTPDLSGTWQGIMIKQGDKIENSAILYLQFKQTTKGIEGFARHEMPGKTEFAFTNVSGKQFGNTYEIKEEKFSRKKDFKTSTWCVVNLTLVYIDSTGYLKGSYSSKVCKNNSGEVILFKSNTKFTDVEKKETDHFWQDKFVKDYKAGIPSPEKLIALRTRFNFRPIYFDTDKDSLKTSYQDYLKQMAIVIKGHSDLRILVTGNTDAVGSDEYNKELSKRRAERILQFFKTQGLTEDKIVIDFKGEKNPVSDNKSNNGKQLNRRVDFNFI